MKVTELSISFDKNNIKVFSYMLTVENEKYEHFYFNITRKEAKKFLNQLKFKERYQFSIDSTIWRIYTPKNQ